MKPFVLELLDQQWVDNEPLNVSDGCSHGRIRLVINGVQIVAEGDEEWTVSTSALKLLRTVFSDYASERSGPLILHCGMVMMAGCPIRVSWDVLHREDLVEISNVIRVPTTNEATVLRFPAADTSLTLVDYGRPILQFADDVARFFSTSQPRRFTDDYDRAEFQSFIKEFDEKREMARALLK
jgi:hypothetical protein